MANKSGENVRPMGIGDNMTLICWNQSKLDNFWMISKVSLSAGIKWKAFYKKESSMNMVKPARNGYISDCEIPAWIAFLWNLKALTWENDLKSLLKEKPISAAHKSKILYCKDQTGKEALWLRSFSPVGIKHRILIIPCIYRRWALQFCKVFLQPFWVLWK